MNARLRVAVSLEGVRSPVSRARLADAARTALRAECVMDAMISITLVSAPRIAALNVKHLGHRGPTDVICFAFTRERAGPLVADIYIAPGVARANARRLGVGVREELLRLVIHGALHAAGRDHPAGEARERSPMWRRQEALVRRAVAGAA